MKIINKKNKILYKYEKHEFSDGVVKAIILFSIAVLLFLVSILISYIFMGEAPMFVVGIGISAIIFDIGSIALIIFEIYLYKNFHSEIRNLLLLQVLFLIMWILIT